MTLLVRHTDVLGGFDPAKGGGGVVGGFNPLNKFLGWREYAVIATYSDPAGIENPVILIRQTKGPATDTVGQIFTRNSNHFVDRLWPGMSPLIRGSYPGLQWRFMDPATMAFVAGPCLPVGDADLLKKQDVASDSTQYRNHFVQWFEMTPPTGPYLAVLTAREPSEEFPIWVSGHPVEIVAEKLTQKGEAYDTASATSVMESLGEKAQVILPVMAAEDTPQDLIDSLSEMFGFQLRRSETSGKSEFVHWRRKFGPMPTPVINRDNVRGDGGPTFEEKDETRVNTVRVSAPIISQWKSGAAQAVSEIRYLRRPQRKTIRKKLIAKAALNDSGKPASGLIVTTNEIAFHYSSDGVTRDAATQGEQDAELSMPGMPAVTNLVEGGATPLNLEQWAEGLARHYFDTHGRGRQMGVVPLLRGVGDEADCLLGEAVAVNLAHFPNAQLGQSPTSQRGGVRPFRIIDRTPEAAGPLLRLADEGTGVQYGTTPEIRVLSAGDPTMLVIEINNADDLSDDGALVLFELLTFGPAQTPDVSKPGLVYTIRNAKAWTTNPYWLLFGPFPAKHQVFLRAYAFLQGGSLSDPSDWYGIGGPITAPTASISNLVISNITDEGADLDWSYDESPQVGDVKVQFRDITGGVIGPYVDASGSPFAPGTESTTLTGLISGNTYEVRVILDNGSEYGNELKGTFTTTGGLISGLVISSVDSSSAKLTWTNTDSGRPIIVEYRVDGTTAWQTFQILAAGSNRIRLTGLQPLTAYNVRVSLGVVDSDGAGGPGLTDDFTTLATSITLEYPLMGGAFMACEPNGTPYQGRFGCRLNPNPNNVVAHDIVVLLAVETAIGSGTPGTFVEQAPMPAIPGADMWFIADAPNDGKLRYMKAISRAVGYLDSIETVVVEADPWSDTVVPPAGGGIPNTYTISEAAVTTGASRTGSFSIPDGAELFRVESPNAKEIRIRLYKDSATVTSDSARAVTDSLWPAGLLFDSTLTSADSYLIDLPITQRIRFVLAQHEDGKVWYRLTSLEAGTEDLQCRLYYFAAPTGSGSGTLF